MPQRLKMLLGFLALIGVTALLGFLGYWFLFRHPPAVIDVDEEEEEETVGGLTGSEDAGEIDEDQLTEEELGILEALEALEGVEVSAVQLTSSTVLSTTLTADGTIAYYDPSDGRFYTIDENGNIVALSNEQFPSAETVLFSDEAEMVAIEFPDGSNVLYDFAAEEQTTLPSHWEEFEFSPESEEVISKNITVDPGSTSLVVTSTDGSKTQVIASLGTNEEFVTLDWSPDGDVVGFSQTGLAQTGFGREQIFLIGADGESVGAIVVEGLMFDSIWAPSGDTLLYSVADVSQSYRPTLWSVDISGSDIGTDRMRYGVETWVEKCTFADSTTVYCAVPREINDGEGLDIELVDSPDDVYEIDITSGRAELVAAPTTDYQMFNLNITEGEDTLYFTDENGILLRISLD